MKALLMHPYQDFDLEQALPYNDADLRQDLELDTLLETMALSDEFLLNVSRRALLTAMSNDCETILYRQEILRDCLGNSGTVRALYDLVAGAVEAARRQWWGLSSEHPSSLLYSSNDLLQAFIAILRKLRNVGVEQGSQFTSRGFKALFAMFSRELSEDYLAEVRLHLTTLQFRKGVLFSAKLGSSNETTRYVLLKPHGKDPNWLERLIGKRPPGYTYHLHPQDEAGGRIMSEMRSRAISRVARALGQSANHVVNFFKMLRTELAFYIACLNLHDALTAKGLPTSFPQPSPSIDRRHTFRGLYDVCLALRMQGKMIGNTIDADGKNLIVITGANQGGKSTFLRSIGVAQLMMQSGLFVGAESFAAEVCTALWTHYKREEDTTMKSGKLDEELARMSEITDHIQSRSLLLFNESFAATNEREGSEIARQIVCALLDKGMKVFFVTHLHEFARNLYQTQRDHAVFLRPERLSDGTRTFTLLEAPPLQTSYGEDLYRRVFGVATEVVSRM